MSDAADDVMVTGVLYGALRLSSGVQWTVDKYTWLPCMTGLCRYLNCTTILCMVIIPNQLVCFFELVPHCKFLFCSWQILTTGGSLFDSAFRNCKLHEV